MILSYHINLYYRPTGVTCASLMTTPVMIMVLLLMSPGKLDPRFMKRSCSTTSWMLLLKWQEQTLPTVLHPNLISSATGCITKRQSLRSISFATRILAALTTLISSWSSVRLKGIILAHVNNTILLTCKLLADGTSVPVEDNIAIHGRDSKMLPANLDFLNQHIIYSTSEILTWATIDGVDYLVLHGLSGESAEIAFSLKGSQKPTAQVGSGSVKSTVSSSSIRLNFKYNGRCSIVTNFPWTWN